MIKILITADNHLGKYYKKLVPERLNERRRKIAEIYNSGLSEIDNIILPENYGSSAKNNKLYHVYNLYTIRVADGRRDALQRHLKNKGIDSMVYYPVPLHKMKVFEGRCKVFGDLKESEKASKEVLSLPIGPLMEEKDVLKVIEAIKEFFDKTL